MKKGSAPNLSRPLKPFDIVCFSHLEWEAVYQRLKHLLSEFAEKNRVFFIEKPLFDAHDCSFDVSRHENNLYRVIPRLPKYMSGPLLADIQRCLLNDSMDEYRIKNYVLWYLTPAERAWSDHLCPLTVIYDRHYNAEDPELRTRAETNKTPAVKRRTGSPRPAQKSADSVIFQASRLNRHSQ